MRPTPLAVRLAGLILALSLLAPLHASFQVVWELGILVALLVLTLDSLRVIRKKAPGFKRRLNRTLPQGVWSEVCLEVYNNESRPKKCRIADARPHTMLTWDLPVTETIPPKTRAEIFYQVRPLTRGLFHFEAPHILETSPWGFWERTHRPDVVDEVRVYPNFRDVAGYMLMAGDHRLTQVGIHQRRKRGEGREFRQLREFVQGDPLRNIDWKASSRMRKLISREFQDERDQQIVFLMDCGMSMRTRDGELSHFDHALNAVILLANVASKHGDAVGLMTFGGQNRSLAPRKGAGQLQLLLNTIYDLQPGLQTADFMAMARQVLLHIRKRTLLVLITNLRDEDDTELAPALQLLKRKHLVLLASMRERALTDALEQDVETFADALRVSGAHAYLHKRKKVHQILRTRGVVCMDTEPDLFPVTAVNNYLDIKGKGLL